MIITRIKAYNLLKYSYLDLTAPETGLIAISGQNESGKSSIGEAICFALFGRTFSITTQNIQKVLHWGENHCEVELTFKLEEDTYQVSRFLDREGNQSAKLIKAGDEEPIVRGLVDVNAMLIKILGYDYEQFAESFYLAQREITTPHPHSQAVKIMAGIEPLEQVVDDVHKAQAGHQAQLAQCQGELAAVQKDIEDLGVKPGHFASLEQEQSENHHQQQQLTDLIGQIQKGAYTYAQNKRQIGKLRTSRLIARFMGFMSALIAMVSGAFGLLLTQGKQFPFTESLEAYLSGQIPIWREVPDDAFFYAAGAGLVLLMLFFWRIRWASHRIRHLNQESANLMDHLVNARHMDVEIAEYDAGDKLDNAASSEDSMRNETPPRPDEQDFHALKHPIAIGEATEQQVMAYTEPEVVWLSYILALLKAEAEYLQHDLDDERCLLDQQAEFQSVLDQHQTEFDALQAKIALLDTSLALLHGAIQHLSNAFNRDIKNLVARTLPLFTDGRYEHLQIDHDLSVRVFSSDKRDFMDLEEVSSGTQRQIMLALRLALSQKLLGRTIKGRQFTFLDEPFAFFDEERTRKALIALANLGEEVSQVWIVAQQFPEQTEVAFAVNIACQRGEERLIA
jgi:exonuclease SbcC